MSWGAPEETLLGNHEGALDVTTEGDLIAIGGGNDIGIWDFHGVKPTCCRYTNTVSSLAFSPDMQYLLVGSNDRTLSLWRVADRQLVAHLRGPSTSDCLGGLGRMTGDYSLLLAIKERRRFGMQKPGVR